jgi:thioredoxin 1
MSVVELNADNFEQEVKQSDIPVIIDFWAEWCGPCQMMGPVFKELSSEYEGKLKFVKANTETNGPVAAEFGVQSIPTLVIVKDGKEVDRLVGFAPKEVLKNNIDQALSKL